MERIKQALERARNERGTEPAPTAGARATAGNIKGQGNGQGNGQGDGKIVYSQTRTFALDDKTARNNRLVTAIDNPMAVAAYKILRTKVLQRMKHEGWNALAVTSPGQGEGKTLTAVNLAISIAQEVNHTVLLVDFDLRHPRVHEYMGYRPDKGVSDFIFNGAELSDVMFNPGIERMVVLPGREPVFNSSEVLSSPKMVTLVEELKSRYPSRIVVFDLPPVLSADDALAFSPYVDGALLVIEDGATTKDEVVQTLDYLSATPVIGTVLNKAEDVPLQSYHG